MSPTVSEEHYTLIDRIIDCPDCTRYCHWCAWYAKNARDAGCGLSILPGHARITRHRCEWDQLKGTTCQTCGGNEKVRLVGQLERMDGSTADPGESHP